MRRARRLAGRTARTRIPQAEDGLHLPQCPQVRHPGPRGSLLPGTEIGSWRCFQLPAVLLNPLEDPAGHQAQDRALADRGGRSGAGGDWGTPGLAGRAREQGPAVDRPRLKHMLSTSPLFLALAGATPSVTTWESGAPGAKRRTPWRSQMFFRNLAHRTPGSGGTFPLSQSP